MIDMYHVNAFIQSWQRFRDFLLDRTQFLNFTHTICADYEHRVLVMMDTTNQGRCGFLTIPAELRNRIYELTIIDEEPINIYDTGNFDRDGAPFFQLGQPALAATCWQIRNESK